MNPLAQRRVRETIDDDLRGSIPMQRLLQGDVGSGKTLVALFALLTAVENGVPAAMVVPSPPDGASPRIATLGSAWPFLAHASP